MTLEEELSRIGCISKSGVRVQNLAHLLNKETLKQCFHELDGSKAVGINKVTKAEYAKELDKNLDKLVSRLKGGTYFPRPSKRVYIDKPGTNKKRPLGMSCFEDKLIERAINKILVAVYEPKFLDYSYGFRPNRNCHMAISRLLSNIRGRTSFVVEADIRSCFDTIDHDKLISFLERDIADRRFIEIIRRELKAGHLEGNIYVDDLTGTVQGSGASPTLANVYLHYVLDTWFDDMRRRLGPEQRFRGVAGLVRYADDFVGTFQYEEDALKFYKELEVRFAEFGFTLAEEKTRVIEFGRFAQANLDERRRLGLTDKTQPDTFDFLGFTFYCAKARETGRFCVKVKSIGKRMQRKLNQIVAWIKKNRHSKLEVIWQHLNRVLKGYFNYYAVSGNSPSVSIFRYKIIRALFKWLNRRSQRKSYNWKGFNQMLESYPIADAHIRVDIYNYRR